jgi:hypothetical protein
VNVISARAAQGAQRLEATLNLVDVSEMERESAVPPNLKIYVICRSDTNFYCTKCLSK